MPAVVAQCREESLIHRPAVKLSSRRGIPGKHVDQAVRLPLQPEGVGEFDPGLESQRARFTSINNSVVVTRLIDGSFPLTKLADEEVVLGGEAVGWGGGVTLEDGGEGLGLGRGVGDFAHGLEGGLVEPPFWGVGEHVG